MKSLKAHPAMHLLTQYITHYNARDLDRVLGFFATKQQMHVWGTGLDESITSVDEMPAQLVREWSQADKSEIVCTGNYLLSDDGRWIDTMFLCHVVIDGQAQTIHNMRGSIYVAEEDGVWKISHIHTSKPALEQENGQSFPVRDG